MDKVWKVQGEKFMYFSHLYLWEGKKKKYDRIKTCEKKNVESERMEKKKNLITRIKKKKNKNHELWMSNNVEENRVIKDGWKTMNKWWMKEEKVRKKRNKGGWEWKDNFKKWEREINWKSAEV